ncbi:uncharacterized protein LOC110854516 [Folsomia candida]|uniref:uncharacterized protein LOC110854516 n=1 Tax=Folsomia candida TaxID=158441 RepID=UPI000B904064|nr:uncharacterized protein LOC110854516 [Folsomia candida]
MWSWNCTAFVVLVMCTSVWGQRCDTTRLSPNPANCSTFIQCDNGQQVIRPCPTGLHFNVAQQICDWPYNVQCGYNPPPPAPDIKCYSCIHIDPPHSNMSSPGCDKSPIPPSYLRTDCFGFGDINVAASVRHTMNATTARNTGNVTCVTYRGRSELGGSLVILRGCENAPSDLGNFKGKKCFSGRQYDFLLPKVGFVRTVEKCYCTGNGCNGGDHVVNKAIGFIGMLLICGVVKMFGGIV